jgi:putative peptide zinc metalloprotease protein
MDLTVNDKIYPLIVSDIDYWKLFDKCGGDIYCLGSIERDKYIEVPEAVIVPVITAINYFDGKHTFEDVASKLLNSHNFKVDVKELYVILCRANLIQDIDEALVEKQELDILTSKLFEIKLKKTYWMLEKLNKLMFPYGMYLSAFIILCGIFFLVRSIKIFISPTSYQVGNSYSLGIAFAVISFFLSIGLHELAHGIVGYKYGLKPSKIVFALYLALSPMIYLKMPGIYSIEPKKRIYVWLAGVYANLFLGSSFIIMSQFTSGNLKNLLLLLTLTNTSLVITNLSPLLPLDGYFILCTLLKKPNLRKGSFREFKKWIIGKNNNFRGISIIYFIFSSLFMCGLIGSQVYWIVSAITKSIREKYSILQIISEFKFILLILSIMLVKKVVGIIIKKVKMHKCQISGVLDNREP